MSLTVNKTYKMLVSGAFVRSESNRTLTALDASGQFLANFPRASRKDVRDAVKAARTSWAGWSSKTAYNRGQILYRLAEMIEGKATTLESVLVSGGASSAEAASEVRGAVDRMLYYAGWADKYQQLGSSVNPVADRYFNFSLLEPMGVVGLVTSHGFLNLVSLVAPAIVGGNSCVVLVSEKSALVACEFGEALATSDLPGGVVNILTGRPSETVPHLAKHMDVNLVCASKSEPFAGGLVKDAAENLKRLFFYDESDWRARTCQGLGWIEEFQEVKTVWHPMGL